MMLPILSGGVLVAWALALEAAAAGGDYILSVESVGFVDASGADEARESVLHSSELLIEAGKRFHSMTKLGPVTVTIGGRADVTPAGEIAIDFRYDYTTKTGETVATGPGVAEPIVNTTACQCRLAGALNRWTLVGGMDTANDTAAGKRYSRHRVRVLVRPCDRDED